MPYIYINQIYPSSESLGIKWDRFGPLPFTFHTISGKNQRKLHVKSIKKGFKMKGKTFAQRPFSNPGLGDWEIIEMQKSDFFLSVFFFLHKLDANSQNHLIPTEVSTRVRCPYFFWPRFVKLQRFAPFLFTFHIAILWKAKT